ncbi:MAG TPA: hypothetical protein VD902_05510, partial [Symbiobacteriaceae bacterium]|nr:hypothetical protein [Symbiobacteriaceae bacterium]
YGAYRNDQSSIEKLTSRTDLVVTANHDGSINVQGVGRCVEVEPLLFQTLDGAQYVAFREDGAGRVTQIAVMSRRYIRLLWWEHKLVHAAVLGLSALAFAWMLLAWLVRLRRGTAQGRAARLAVALLRAVCGVNLAFAIGLVVTLLVTGLEGGGTPLDYGIPPLLIALLGLPLLSVALTGACIAGAAVAWRRCFWTLAGRVQHSVVTLCSVAFLCSLWYWNMIGFKF